MTDSSDEEIIDILLPVQELTRERDELRAAIEQTWRPEVEALRRQMGKWQIDFENEAKANVGLPADMADIAAERDKAWAEAESWRNTTALMHQVDVLMLERLSIAWTPGEPFVAVVEGEIERLRAEMGRIAASHELAEARAIAAVNA